MIGISSINHILKWRFSAAVNFKMELLRYCLFQNGAVQDVQ